MNGTHCVQFEGRCDQVYCEYCPLKKPFAPEKPRALDDAHYSRQAAPEQSWTVSEQGFLVSDVGNGTAPPDMVLHPAHYSRWAMEPIEFIAINNLPWWLANVIKYAMRYDAKDGLQDLYKACSYLEMKIREVKGEKRFWDKPVSDERKLNDNATAKAA